MNVNVRQRKFAALAAQGAKLVDAHEQAYGKGKATRKTRSENASVLAKQPKVRALIEEYAAAQMPIGDLRECRLRMLANIQHLAYNAPDARVRLAASIHLQTYADERERQDRERRNAPITIDSLMHEMQALNAPEPTVELEDVADAETASARGDAASEPREPAEPGGVDDDERPSDEPDRDEDEPAGGGDEPDE